MHYILWKIFLIAGQIMLWVLLIYNVASVRASVEASDVASDVASFDI